MNKLNPMLLDSDVIVFATPIYYWNKDLKQETIGLFIPEIYKSIRTDNGIVEQ